MKVHRFQSRKNFACWGRAGKDVEATVLLLPALFYFITFFFVEGSRKLQTTSLPHVISASHSETDDSCALLGYYAPSGGNPFPTFRVNILVPSSWVKKVQK